MDKGILCYSQMETSGKLSALGCGAWDLRPYVGTRQGLYEENP